MEGIDGSLARARYFAIATKPLRFEPAHLRMPIIDLTHGLTSAMILNGRCHARRLLIARPPPTNGGVA
ncbi:hypothetical protein XH80_37845 [Bradyrhizobium sp. CCBAU 45384]|nr:hypothetical protein [Bradyrhizobium sp. CCBAU 45384]